MNNQTPSLVAALLEWQAAQGWSQHRMAEELGLHDSHYSAFVHGKRKLPSRALKRAYAMGIDPQVLLQLKDEVTPV